MATNNAYVQEILTPNHQVTIRLAIFGPLVSTLVSGSPNIALLQEILYDLCVENGGGGTTVRKFLWGPPNNAYMQESSTPYHQVTITLAIIGHIWPLDISFSARKW